MSSQPSITEEPSKGTRITITSSTKFSSVVDRFRQLVPPAPTFTAEGHTRETFELQVNRAVGPFGFTRFLEINHGDWIPLFLSTSESTDRGLNGDRQVLRIIFGNPLIAITMIREDVDAGLHVPVEVLFVEQGDAGTRAVLQLPSGLIAGHERGARNEKLVKAAKVLDSKALELIKHCMN